MANRGDPYRSVPRKFRPGELLEELEKFQRSGFTDLIRLPASEWESLDVDYEPPRVERLWRTHGEYRVSLHRIHPCKKALCHPHPWPSVIWITSGLCEMAVGYDDPEGLGQTPEGTPEGFRVAEVARVRLAAGSSYEMPDPRAWHYVKPLGGPTTSVMLSWPPFHQQVYSHESFGQKRSLNPLSDAGKENLLGEFFYQFMLP